MLSVAKRLLYGQRIREKSTELPYDAEVEWLESTGEGQYIDTGVQGLIGYRVECSYCGMVDLETDTNSSYPQYVFYSASGFIAFGVYRPAGAIGSAAREQTSVAVGTVSGQKEVQMTKGKWFYVVCDNVSGAKQVIIDGEVVHTATGTSGMSDTSPTIALFASHTSASPYFHTSSACKSRIASFKVTDTTTGEVIKDLIPVRKNGIGYMYDKVTGNLLGNLGTGAFLYGKDKNPLYAAEVDYIESTGTQWIDTGIGGRDGLQVRTRAMPISGYVYGTLSGRAYLTFRLVTGSSYFTGSAWSANANFSDFPVSSGVIHEILANTTSGNKSVAIDGTVVHSWSSTTAAVGNITLGLFAYHTNSMGESNYGQSRIYSFSIRDTSTGQLLIYLVPVRVLRNGKFVGAMYDRVTDTVLENSGTGDILVGRDTPYDYEVEYIQRDCSVAWLNASGNAGTGGYDISKYLDGSSMMTSTRPIEARWSTDPGNGGGTLSAIVMPFNILWGGAYLGRASAGVGYRYNNWWEYTIGTNGAPQFDIDTFHVTKASPNGSGTWTYLFDGTEVGSSNPSSSTVAFSNAVLLRYSSTAPYQNLRMRVSFVRLGSDAYFIPVVKGNSKGFYNLVDGELFLEEQACLSAGPKK